MGSPSCTMGTRLRPRSYSKTLSPPLINTLLKFQSKCDSTVGKGYMNTKSSQLGIWCYFVKDGYLINICISSSYPVILSLENHCSISQQKTMATHMVNILGGILALFRLAVVFVVVSFLGVADETARVHL